MSYHFWESSGACLSTVLMFIPILWQAAVQIGGAPFSLMCCSLYSASALILLNVPMFGLVLSESCLGGIRAKYKRAAGSVKADCCYELKPRTPQKNQWKKDGNEKDNDWHNQKLSLKLPWCLFTVSLQLSARFPAPGWALANKKPAGFAALGSIGVIPALRQWGNRK